MIEDKRFSTNCMFYSMFNEVSADDGTLAGGKVEVTETKLLEMIESAYPNPLTIVDISK